MFCTFGVKKFGGSVTRGHYIVQVMALEHERIKIKMHEKGKTRAPGNLLHLSKYEWRVLDLILVFFKPLDGPKPALPWCNKPYLNLFFLL